MAVARGKLYVLGCYHYGWPAQPAASTLPFEVYDPKIDMWFASTPPALATGSSLAGHCLVSNQSEGLMLSMGGCLEQHNSSSVTQQNRGQYLPVSCSQISVFDVLAGRWMPSPAGCSWPGGAACSSVGAVSIDPYTILTLWCESGVALGDHWASTRLLDLRMWRWRSQVVLQRSSGCVQDMGLALHEGRAVAVGGSCCSFTGQASGEVHVYNPLKEMWEELPSLPFGVYGAAPVSVRMHNVLQQQGIYKPCLSS
eukprot:gene5471-5706_t